MKLNRPQKEKLTVDSNSVQIAASTSPAVNRTAAHRPCRTVTMVGEWNRLPLLQGARAFHQDQGNSHSRKQKLTDFAILPTTFVPGHYFRISNINNSNICWKKIWSHSWGQWVLSSRHFFLLKIIHYLKPRWQLQEGKMAVTNCASLILKFLGR